MKLIKGTLHFLITHSLWFVNLAQLTSQIIVTEKCNVGTAVVRAHSTEPQWPLCSVTSICILGKPVKLPCSDLFVHLIFAQWSIQKERLYRDHVTQKKFTKNCKCARLVPPCSNGPCGDFYTFSFGYTDIIKGMWPREQIGFLIIVEQQYISSRTKSALRGLKFRYVEPSVYDSRKLKGFPVLITLAVAS